MKRRIEEHWILFISVTKWTFYATLVGVIVGFSTTIFLKALNWSTDHCRQYPLYFFFLPLALLISTWLVKTFAPDAEGHGTEKVIEAIHKKSGHIKPAVVPIKLMATIVTLAFGGSAGKEGPCAQIGAGLSSALSSFFRFNDAERKKLVICGISAGFASVFGTPIAGALFGVEVLFVGAILYDVLLPSFISGIMAYHVGTVLGNTYFHHPLSFVPKFSEFFFIKVCLSGVFFGLCASLLIEALNLGKKIARRIKLSEYVRPIVGGFLLVILAIGFSDVYLGLGLRSVEGWLTGVLAPWPALLLKPIFTSITLNFGGSGGIVTPIFFIGSAAGSLFGQWTGLDPATFAAIGLVSTLAGAANTPIAASVMAVELFGSEVAPYATIACVISFLMTGHRSVYPSQILEIKKSASIDVHLGSEIDEAAPKALHRKTSWSEKIRVSCQFIAKRMRIFRTGKE